VRPDPAARCPDCARTSSVAAGRVVYPDGKEQRETHMLIRLNGRIASIRLHHEQALARIAMHLIHPTTTDRQVLLEVQQILLRAPHPESVAPGRRITGPQPAPQHTTDVDGDQWEEVLP
jgi:hypothetical protein